MEIQASAYVIYKALKNDSGFWIVEEYDGIRAEV